jgi:hypothetical protein
MEKRCHVCRHCKYLDSVPYALRPFDCRCIKNNGLIDRENVCDWFEFREEKCRDCRYCVFEPNSCNPEQIIGWCTCQQFARQPDGQEYIKDDTVACCEFVRKKND